MINMITEVQNICEGCEECIINEYNYYLATAGYDDKGNNIIVACPMRNYWEGDNKND